MVEDPGNRRRFRRIRAPVFSRPLGTVSTTMRRQVRDISHGGLRVYSDEKHKVGQTLEIELVLPSGGTLILTTAVVWVESLPKGSPARFDLGLRYLELSPEEADQLDQVLA